MNLVCTAEHEIDTGLALYGYAHLQPGDRCPEIIAYSRMAGSTYCGRVLRRKTERPVTPAVPIPMQCCPNCHGSGQVPRDSKLNSWRSRGMGKCRRCKGGGRIPYTYPEMRHIAMGAVRSEIRKQGDPRPETYSADGAWTILEEIKWQDPETVAAWFYCHAPESQIALWFREWRAWCREATR